MISKPFDHPKPGNSSDPRELAGWKAERDVAFVLDREFGDPAQWDVRTFHDLRFPATFASGEVVEGDFAQIDHLVLHRSGMVLVESKSVHGDLHVDHLGQWRRVRAGRRENMASPVTQVERQALALRRLCQAANPPLLNKVAGLIRAGFGNFSIRGYVAIGVAGRFTGETSPFEATVVKVDRIAAVVRAELARHRARTGVVGLLRGVVSSSDADAGLFDLSNEEMDRIERHLCSVHQPRHRAIANSGSPTSTMPPSMPHPSVPDGSHHARPGARVTRLESLACSKCRSVNVRIVFARDYCLKCGECGRFTRLPYSCPLCGEHATIRKDGPIHYRQCDGPGGCGSHVVFSR